ncbi:MAG TPA: ABC transporter ATP-binding protein [Methylibium sp.]|uniref:ABC transporter ATP-binding protein n=1 Tax=Methylibium sp. TaxID=2067992 RepID=UPI002DB9D31E|nr:ABC transporter ATP-binding protein [Methylibium sp.]HEU4458022.1 ABC transporter ATP-binding protein [Methylibium sp.]
MLEARGLHKRYAEAVALHPLDLKVEPGEIFALLGANGAGKTTTIHLFMGFVEPSGGQALVGGVEVARDPLAAKRRVAYIPENVMLYGALSGLENLAYFATLALGRRPGDAELAQWLDQAGLARGRGAERVAGYSKGMRQKVGIAIALAKGAQALLLDEPTSGLDPKAANEFSRLLQQLKAQGVAILMATHDLFLAKQAADRVGIMRRGRLLKTMATAELDHVDLERVYLELQAEDDEAEVAA